MIDVSPVPQPQADATSHSEKRAHLVTSAILAGVVGAIALIVSYPILLLWILLAIAAVMAYAAVYLLVSARLEEEAPAAPAALPRTAASPQSPAAATDDPPEDSP